MMAKFPSQRFTLNQIRGSSYFQAGEIASRQKFLEEVMERYKSVENFKQMDMGKHNHESHSVYYSEIEEAEDEFLMQDNQLFQACRKGYIGQIEEISKLLKH